MILVDSSVWIAVLRDKASPAAAGLATLVRDHDDQILVGDLILLEILQGARDHAHADRIERNLRHFPIVPLLDDALAVKAAWHYRHLRGRGITVCKTIDLIIGTFCIAHGHLLLHDDRDFDPMATYLGLGVVSG